MRLRPEQLGTALKKNLSAIYFVTGDEPLQMGEVADAIRLAAKTAGYTTREICSVGSGFEWYELAETANALSIFADKKIVDVRMPTAKPGNDGAKALCSYCERLPEETLLLITAPKVDKASQQTKWFKTLEQAGVVIQVWPLEGAGLIQWLQQRVQKRGLHIAQDGIKALASRVEGNLLAASQEIEKLYILHGDAAISRQMVEDAVADSARFDVFKLTDSILAGRFNRATKILNGLKAEDTAASIVVWALAREARMLINIKIALNQGENKEAAFKKNRLWDKRKQLVNAALSRMNIGDFQQVLLLSSKADRQIKGQEEGDVWETLLLACLLFCTPI
jgi:DNA polymerase-3 subunit delta